MMSIQAVGTHTHTAVLAIAGALVARTKGFLSKSEKVCARVSLLAGKISALKRFESGLEKLLLLRKAL